MNFKAQQFQVFKETVGNRSKAKYGVTLMPYMHSSNKFIYFHILSGYDFLESGLHVMKTRDIFHQREQRIKAVGYCWLTLKLPQPTCLRKPRRRLQDNLC